MITPFAPQEKLLLGPGPSPIYPSVLASLSKPTLGHLDPDFIRMMDEIKELMQYAFQTENALTMPVSAPGSAGMETCFVNLVEPGDKVIVCRNGVFGMRMQENVERLGGEAIVLEFEWGKPVDPNEVEQAIKQHSDAKILAFVHAETSTGVCSDAKTLCALAKQAGMLTIVDAVTSLGGSELRVDDWGIDAIYSGSQKCLSAPPGLSPISFSQAALDKLAARETKVASWFLDLSLVTAYWGGAKRSYHHTAPVNQLYSLHESLRLLKEESLESSWQRHQKMHKGLLAGLATFGMTPLVEEAYRLPQLNTVIVPEGIDEASVRTQMLNDHQIEIGAGLGALAGKVWRIGLMGYGAQPDKIRRVLSALAVVMSKSASEAVSEADRFLKAD